MATSNMQQAMAKAAQNAKSPSASEARDQAAVTHQATPTPDFAAQMAQMQAVMQQLMDTNAKLLADNTALKAGKAPEKEKKTAISAKNCTYTHDETKGTVTIVIDLNADILGDDGQPKVSTSGATTGVAQLSGSFLDKRGRKVGVSMNAYHKLGK